VDRALGAAGAAVEQGVDPVAGLSAGSGDSRASPVTYTDS
jgi:hypothetical protein